MTDANEEEAAVDSTPETSAGHEELADRYRRARMFFEAHDYIAASRILAEVEAAAPHATATRLLLARAYYHSAQLRRAEQELRQVLERDPSEAYAHLMLGRTLQRQSRHREAVPHLRLAAAMTGESPARR